MKRRKTRFSPGGDAVDNPSSLYEDDELSRANQMFLASQMPEDRSSSKALYDETSGKELSTRRNLETGEYYSTEPIKAPKRAAPREMPKAPPIKETAKRPYAADIRKVEAAAEEKAMAERQKRLSTPGSDAAEPLYPEKYLLGGGAGVGLKALHSAAKGLAPYSAKQIATGAKEGLATAVKSGPKAGLEVAQSTMKGMKGRSGIQASRAARQRAEAEAMEKAKPILQSRKDTKASRAARTRRTEEDLGIEFSKGGSASRRADGCAQRGKTRGKIY